MIHLHTQLDKLSDDAEPLYSCEIGFLMRCLISRFQPCCLTVPSLFSKTFRMSLKIGVLIFHSSVEVEGILELAVRSNL